MKDILKYIGTILGIIFLLVIVIDFATYTWPNEPDSITLLFYKNRYWVFLFSVICAIIIKAEAGWCFKKYDTTLDVPIIDIKES